MDAKQKADQLRTLAAAPVGSDQIERGRVLCGSSIDLHDDFDRFIATKPTRGQAVEKLTELAERYEGARPTDEPIAVCRALGINTPTASELLLAQRLVKSNQSLSEYGLAIEALRRELAEVKANSGPGLVTGVIVGAAVGALF